MRVFAGFVAICAIVKLSDAAPAAQSAAEPLAVAQILAAKYPAQPIMSYIPALSWASQMRLAALTKEPQWRDKAAKDIQLFVSGQTPAIAEPYRLTSMAGALAFADAASLNGDAAAGALAQKVAAFILPQKPDEVIRFATGWTDDMFMASAVLSRVDNGAHAAVVGKLLTSYTGQLQRPDGLFIHAIDGPHAWGRGNGFALLGLTEALTYLPASWTDRPRVLEIYRKHTRALAAHQSDDGSWRQVIDEPTSYRELTVTAMVVASLARGVTRGWIDHATFDPIINRGWLAVATRVNADGTVKNVCSGTGAGPTKEYYLNRPEVNGADDRGGAMALLAAIEMESMRRALR
ncbi:MAG TPA: glycoside hydrolase family 88 protein [Vicinamibacterales bacterium]|nr:glycoside hydrolase family 88 protein [Vicinamibacterales bacterium]